VPSAFKIRSWCIRSIPNLFNTEDAESAEKAPNFLTADHAD